MDILHKQKILINNACLCNSVLARLQGYMYTKKPKQPALVFQNCTGLHMLFCFFPLLVIVLDQQNTIEDLYILKPWQLGPLYFPGKLLIETPALYLQQELQRGDKLEFQPQLEN